MYSVVKFFELIFESFPDGIIILDANNNIVYINKMAEKLRHINRDEKIGKNVLDCHPEHSKEKVLRALKFLKEKKKIFNRMVIDKFSDRIFENTYQAIINEEGEVIGSIVISRDITEKHRLEKENMKYNQALKEQVIDLTQKLNNLYISSLTSLVNTLEAKDPYTQGHSMRVTEYSKKYVAQVIGQSQLLLDIEIAGKLHDIGKIGIKESILNKPGKLTEEEYMEMQKHPVITEQILSPFSHLSEVINIAKHHHERYDGKGYPDKLQGEEIHIGSRILALADSFDAMTSMRAYRDGLPYEVAVEEIEKNLGSQFDPEVGKVFIELIESGSI